MSLGALAATQKTRGRSTSLTIVGNPALGAMDPKMNATATGTVDDVLRLRGLVLGGWVGYALDAGLPIHFRLGAGGVFGSMSDARRGSFTASKDKTRTYSVGTVVETQSARFVFVTPEVRVGWTLGKHVELNAGLLVPVLFAVSRPTWSDKDGIHAGIDGYGWFNADALVNGVLVTVVPTIGARFDL